MKCLPLVPKRFQTHQGLKPEISVHLHLDIGISNSFEIPKSVKTLTTDFSINFYDGNAKLGGKVVPDVRNNFPTK
jgi:hypothetical protein